MVPIDRRTVTEVVTCRELNHGARMPQMTRALGPHDELVDVRRPGTYEEWHERDGLRCLTCGNRVHVMQRHNLWIRHTGDAANALRCAASTGPEGYNHALLKYWIRDWLRARQFDAECERTVTGGARPDVMAIGPTGRSLAFEVQLAHLPSAEAAIRTERLRATGHEVLWVTHHCNWVASLPAVGLHLQHEVRSHLPADDIGGVYCWIREGILTCSATGQLVGGAREPTLSVFLQHYLEQRVRWAPRQTGQYGWAMSDDWISHLEWQNARITQLERQLALANLKNDEQHRQLVTDQENLASQEAKLGRSAEEIKTIYQSHFEATRDHARALDLARQDVLELEQYQRDNKRLRDGLEKSFWGRRFLNRYRVGPS